MSRRAARHGFTLVELLTVVALMVALASMSLFAMWGAGEEAKAERTRSIVKRIDVLIERQWDSMKTRRISVRSGLGLNTRIERSLARLTAVRELQRMTLPERKSDVVNGAFVLSSPPSAWRSHVRRCRRQLGGTGMSPNYAAWTEQYQGAECLYLILASISDGDANGLDILKESEIGDLDGDGMKEVLDGWGRTVDFIRWAPGYLSNQYDSWRSDHSPSKMPPADPSRGLAIEIVTPQTAPYWELPGTANERAVPSPAPDAFDTLRVDPRWHDSTTSDAGNTSPTDPTYFQHRINDPFELRPLIYSGGPDRIKDVDSPNNFAAEHSTDISPQMQAAAAAAYSGLSIHANLFRNDPYRYYTGAGGFVQMGMPRRHAADNISNHTVEAR